VHPTHVHAAPEHADRALERRLRRVMLGWDGESS